MEQQEIIKGNKLIAESPFASEFVKNSIAHFRDSGNEQELQRFFAELKYHESWDWLMPVAAKFTSQDFTESSKEIQHEYNKLVKMVYHSIARNFLIEEAHDALVCGIKWYNEQSAPKS